MSVEPNTMAMPISVGLVDSRHIVINGDTDRLMTSSF